MARPGGNITGFTSFEYSIGGKWLGLLKESAPSMTRVLVVLNPQNYTSRALLRTIETVAPARGVRVVSAEVRNIAEIQSAISAFAQEPRGGFILLPDPITSIGQPQIIALALKHQLPGIHQSRLFPARGGLMSYGPDFPELYRKAASYVDRILKGAKVGELPVQNPTKFAMTINLKTAKALGLSLPPTLLARADEVIE
jgi:putative ABC transport system substrate-binding protein